MKIRILEPQEHHIGQLQALSQDFASENSWAIKTPLGQLESQEKAKAKLFGVTKVIALVAEQPEGHLVGFCGVYQEQPGIYEASILIDRRFRKTGAGKQLIDGVFARLPKKITVEAWVFAKNQEALDAFPRLGFRLREIIDNVNLDDNCHQVYLYERTT